MKKTIILLCTLALFLLPFLPVKPAKAGLWVIDVSIPSNLGIDMASLRTYDAISPSQVMAQTFWADQNYILGVSVYLRNGNGDTITARLDDFWDHTTVATKTQTISTVAGWVEFDFDAPVEVNKAHNYGLYLSTVSDTDWVWLEKNPYFRGDAIKNGSVVMNPEQYDYSLIVYTTNDLASAGPDAGDNPGGNPVAADNSNANSAVVSGSANQSSGASNTTSSSTKTVDASINEPTLEYIIANGTKTLAPIPDNFSIKRKDILTIDGKSFAEAKVVLNIGEKSYNTIANNGGIWEITIPTTDLALGSITVQAQAQDLAKNKGSEIIDLFKFTLTDEEDAAPAVSTAKKSFWDELTSEYLWYVYGILGILLIGLCVVYYFVAKRNKQLLSK